jgi:predicted GNAT family N-acyltransferase
MRAIVFIEEQGVSYKEEIDGYDDTAIHFLVTINGRSDWCGTTAIM